ncbi:MAG: tetratricopeptide repeat protein [Actinoallomurus sp.]
MEPDDSSVPGEFESYNIDLRWAQGVQFGTNLTQHNTFVSYLSATDITWPVRVGAIPQLADGFQPRDELGELRSVGIGGAQPTRVQVLSGMGGVGKSQIAAAYARSVADELDLVIWISARHRDAVIAAYTQAAMQIGHPMAGSAEQSAQGFLSWLQTTDRRSLIVLDDVVDPRHLRHLWPDGDNSKAVITTQRRDAILAEHGAIIDVGIFTPPVAREYLGMKLRRSPSDGCLDEADELAADLGYLPLALAQASAFILDRNDTCQNYRVRFADRRQRLAKLLPPDALADDHHATVASTWSMSVDLADTLTPANLCRPLLQLASVFDPTGFPLETLMSEPSIDYVESQLRQHVDESVSRQDCRDAIHNCVRLNLLAMDGEAGFTTVQIHSLSQRATLDTLDRRTRRETVQTAEQALGQIWPAIEDDPNLSQSLRVNASWLGSEHGESLWENNIPSTLWTAGDSLTDWGFVDSAVRHWSLLVDVAGTRLDAGHPELLVARAGLAFTHGQTGDHLGVIEEFRRLKEDCVAALGPDDPLTLRATSNIARWLGRSGDLTGAASVLEGVLADRTRVLGSDHRDTIQTRQSLAGLHGRAGHLSMAISELRELLREHEDLHAEDPLGVLSIRRTLATCLSWSGDLRGAIEIQQEIVQELVHLRGPDHPAMLSLRDDLATLRGRTGDLVGAIADLEQVLADRVRLFGADHPGVLITRSHLATFTGISGDVSGAVEVFAAILDDRTRILGPAHPQTLTTRAQLAIARRHTGDLVTATAEIEQLLEDREPILGHDHPDILLTRYQLADLRGRAGATSEALALSREVLADRVRILGPLHPQTLESYSQVANERGHSGDPRGAVEDSRRSLDQALEVLGTDHPGTLRLRHTHAYWLGRSGKPEEAVAEFELLLADLLAILGPDHPHTLSCRHDLAYWVGRNGDTPAAVERFQKALSERLRVLGPDHPSTLNTQHGLARFLVDADKTAEAVLVSEEVCAARSRVLGADHPNTLSSRNDFAKCLGQSGDTERAISELADVIQDRDRILGPGHPHSLHSRQAMAYWLARSGNLSQAIAEFEDVLRRRTDALGPDHQDTLSSRHDLAYWRGRSGDRRGAILGFEEALAERIRVLGDDHPHTLNTRHNLADWRGKAGDIDAAVAGLEEVLAERERMLGLDHRNTLTSRKSLDYWRRRQAAAAVVVPSLAEARVRHPAGSVVEAVIEHVSEKARRAWLKLPDGLEATISFQDGSTNQSTDPGLEVGAALSATVVEVAEHRGRPQVHLAVAGSKPRSQLELLEMKGIAVGQVHVGPVREIVERLGLFVEVIPGVNGLVYVGTLRNKDTTGFHAGQLVEVVIARLAEDPRRPGRARVGLKLSRIAEGGGGVGPVGARL